MVGSSCLSNSNEIKRVKSSAVVDGGPGLRCANHITNHLFSPDEFIRKLSAVTPVQIHQFLSALVVSNAEFRLLHYRLVDKLFPDQTALVFLRATYLANVGMAE